MMNQYIPLFTQNPKNNSRRFRYDFIRLKFLYHLLAFQFLKDNIYYFTFDNFDIVFLSATNIIIVKP